MIAENLHVQHGRESVIVLLSPSPVYAQHWMIQSVCNEVPYRTPRAQEGHLNDDFTCSGQYSTKVLDSRYSEKDRIPQNFTVQKCISERSVVLVPITQDK